MDLALCRICGWEKASQVPHDSTFSRTFAERSRRLPPGTYSGEGPAVRFTLTREKLQGFVDGLKREWAEVVERNKDVMAPTRQGVQPHS